MTIKKYSILAQMSGTSLDGMDWAWVDLEWDGKRWLHTIVQAKTYAYSPKWKSDLQNAIQLDESKLLDLHIVYGFYIGEVALKFLNDFSLPKPHYLSVHGHTVFHQPNKGITFQLGDGNTIFNTTKIPTICDFRTQDVQLGGQGAPLAPIADIHLYPQFDCWVNLGGFSNITKRKNNTVIAFDVSPLNIVLNRLTHQIGLEYDSYGEIAKNNSVDSNLLQELNDIEYYQQLPPKSLGLEWVNEHVFPILEKYQISIEDKIATYTQHAAFQLFKNLSGTDVLFTGGGTYNSYFMELCKNMFGEKIHIPSNLEIEFKECVIFALLAAMRLENQNNILSSYTGSSKDHCSGFIFNISN